MKAQRSFTVRPRLPERLRGLEALASNLRWSWDRPTQELFSRIDPTHWESVRHDPRRLLAAVSPERLEELAAEDDFVNTLGTVAAQLDTYITSPRWFQGLLAEHSVPTGNEGRGVLDGHKVAYFSPEFGISEAIPQYSGGLGVLAGDHVKAASDLGVPLVAIGLFYRHGYFRQSLSVDGWQQERFYDLDPHALALEPCEGVRVHVELAGREMVLQVWRASVGRVPLYLLDADLPTTTRATCSWSPTGSTAVTWSTGSPGDRCSASVASAHWTRSGCRCACSTPTRDTPGSWASSGSGYS